MARFLGLAVAIVVLGGEAAWAGCTPASADNVTATCSGITFNQGTDPADSSFSFNAGYGGGSEIGVTVNVDSGAGNTVTGTNVGIDVGDVTVTNGTGAGISGALPELPPISELPVSPIPAALPARRTPAFSPAPTRR